MATAQRGVVAALKERNFLLYIIGTMFSTSGTWFQNVAQTLLVYRLTNSVFLVGVVNLAQFAGVLFLAPAAGIAADRYDRRWVLLLTQVVSSLVAAGLAALAFAGHANVPVVIAAALLLGLAQTFSVPAMLSLVPQLVPPDNVQAAVALNIVTFNLARAVGPVLGALVVAALGTSAAFALNSISFAVLALALTMVRTQPRERLLTGARTRLGDTLAAVRAKPELARAFVAGTCASIAIDPVTTLTPAFATDVFGRSDTLVGWMIGAFGTGAVMAGLWVSQLSPPTDRQLGKRLFVLVVSMFCFALTAHLSLALVALVSAGFGFIALSASALTRIQLSSADGELGRLMALWAMAFMGSRPIASVVDGAVATVTGVSLATAIVVMPAALVALSLVRRVR